jgi:hypothetical protein
MVGCLLLALGVTACPLGRGNNELGEACRDNNECAGASCKSGICSARCKSDADCASTKAKLVCQKEAPSPNNPENYGDCKVAPP